MSTILNSLVKGWKVGLVSLVFFSVMMLGNSAEASFRHRRHHRGHHHTYRVYSHRSYGYGSGNSTRAYAAAQTKQMQMALNYRVGEERAFLAAFDTNRNGKIDGDEIGPAGKYLREVRMGKILPMPPLGMNQVASNKRK